VLQTTSCPPARRGWQAENLVKGSSQRQGDRAALSQIYRRDGMVSFCDQDNTRKPQVRTLAGGEVLRLVNRHTQPLHFQRVKNFALLDAKAKRLIQLLKLTLESRLPGPDPPASGASVLCERCGKEIIILARMVEPSHHRLCCFSPSSRVELISSSSPSGWKDEAASAQPAIDWADGLMASPPWSRLNLDFVIQTSNLKQRFGQTDPSRVDDSDQLRSNQGQNLQVCLHCRNARDLRAFPALANACQNSPVGQDAGNSELPIRSGA